MFFANINSDVRSASEVPDKLFLAMQKKDAEGIKKLFVPGGQFIAIQKSQNGEGESTIRNFTVESFTLAITGATGARFVEKMPVKDVKITGDMAVVSGRYTFYIGKNLSHCGTNTFNLARTDAGWKIANGASTIEFDCKRDLRAVEIPIIEADPKDVETIDGIIKALYESISGAVGKKREWGRDRTLYTPDIRFISISSTTDKSNVSRVTHQQYVNNNDEFLSKHGFTEREINRVTRRFGNIAQVFSSYEWETADKKQKGRGINSIQLFFDGKRWWISGLSWQNEHSGNSIPEEFLRSKQ
jgi:uncharacterized protein (TIGR02246 family)